MVLKKLFQRRFFYPQCWCWVEGSKTLSYDDHFLSNCSVTCNGSTLKTLEIWKTFTWPVGKKTERGNEHLFEKNSPPPWNLYHSRLGPGHFFFIMVVTDANWCADLQMSTVLGPVLEHRLNHSCLNYGPCFRLWKLTYSTSLVEVFCFIPSSPFESLTNDHALTASRTFTHSFEQ